MGAIGIFDSGVGGLTVANAINKMMPHEDTIYLGDTKHMPYGNKSTALIQQYSLDNCHFLIKQNVKAIVIACHTASALALKTVLNNFDIPIIGVIEPTILYFKKNSPKSVAVFGTKKTIESNIYATLINAELTDCKVTNIACPLAVNLVEEMMINSHYAHMIIKGYLNNIPENLDTAILGCTHYPFLKHIFEQYLPVNTTIIDSSENCVVALMSTLKAKNLLSTNKEKGFRKYFVSENPHKFQYTGSKLINSPIPYVYTTGQTF